MKIFKKYTDLILEQDGIDLSTEVNTKPIKKVVTDTKKDTTVTDTVPAAAASTAPDPAVMAKLLKIPNSRGAKMYNTNETAPTEDNAVAIEVPNTGRSYNFRSKPTSLTVYINDGSGNTAYTGTYTMTDTAITMKSTDGKVTEVIGFDGKLAIDPTTKQPQSNLPSNESDAQKQKSVALNVAAAIRANSNYWADSNEEVVNNATEAAFYWIVKNKLNKDQVKEFLATAFTKDAADTYREMEGFSWSDFTYAPFAGNNPAGRVMDRILEWNPDWASENDEDTTYLKSKVPSTNSLASYEPSGDDAKKWAETIWSIIDDSWVSADEEVNAIMAILVLTSKGLINVDAAWKDLQTLGVIDTQLGIDAAIADEVDSPEAGELVKRFAAALRGNPSEGAKKMLQLS